ncbi:hypothetical protein C8R44DRAFT_774395 [Mycena epipterygia]|nr:hypothetical protein C8R44DRAFT_774395 [Mycena epipterygia]
MNTTGRVALFSFALMPLMGLGGTGKGKGGSARGVNEQGRSAHDERAGRVPTCVLCFHCRQCDCSVDESVKRREQDSCCMFTFDIGRRSVDDPRSMGSE